MLLFPKHSHTLHGCDSGGMTGCSAFGCRNRTDRKKPGLTFHRFPKKAEQRKAWIVAVRRKDWKPSATSILCSEHFTEDKIDRTSVSCVRIKENAIPNVFTGFPAYLQKKHKNKILMLESKLRRKENSHKSDLHEQEVKAKCLEGLNKEYTKLNGKSKMIRELKLELDSLQTANQETRDCPKTVEKENEKLQNLLHKNGGMCFSGEMYSLNKSEDIRRNVFLPVKEKEKVIIQLHQNLESVTKEKEYTKLNWNSKMNRELKLKLDSLQTANQETRDCPKTVEKENEKLQNILHRNGGMCFSEEMYSLHLKVKEKEKVIIQLHQNLESVTKEKDQLKQQLSTLKDVYKSNDVVCELARQFKELKEKLKVKENIIHKNEELQAKKTKNFEDIIRGLTNQIKAAERDKREVENLKSKFAVMEKELLERQEAITLKSNIIKHLNDQLLNIIQGQDSPWNGEISNEGLFPKIKNEAALPSNQVPREHCLDSRYFQRHQPLPLHNLKIKEEPSY